MNHLPVQPCFKHSQLHLRIWECHYWNRHFLVQLGVMHPAQGHLESMYERFPQWGCNQKQLVCVVRPRWRGEKRSQLFRVKSLPSQRRGTHNNHLNITYRQIFLEATCIVAHVKSAEKGALERSLKLPYFLTSTDLGNDCLKWARMFGKLQNAAPPNSDVVKVWGVGS